MPRGSWPQPPGCLVLAITLIVTLVARIHAAGETTRTTVRDRRRAAARRARSISAHLKLRSDEVMATVLAITGELADLAESTVTETRPGASLLPQARDSSARSIQR
jgi:transposase, IS5 family